MPVLLNLAADSVLRQLRYNLMQAVQAIKIMHKQ